MVGCSLRMCSGAERSAPVGCEPCGTLHESRSLQAWRPGMKQLSGYAVMGPGIDSVRNDIIGQAQEGVFEHLCGNDCLGE